MYNFLSVIVILYFKGACLLPIGKIVTSISYHTFEHDHLHYYALINKILFDNSLFNHNITMIYHDIYTGNGAVRRFLCIYLMEKMFIVN